MLPETEVILKIPTARISLNPSTLIIDLPRSVAGQNAFVIRCNATILSKIHPSAFPQKQPSCRPVPLFAPATLFSNKNPFNAILEAVFQLKFPKITLPLIRVFHVEQFPRILSAIFSTPDASKKFSHLFNFAGMGFFAERLVCRSRANGVQTVLVQSIESEPLRWLGTQGVLGFNHE